MKTYNFDVELKAEEDGRWSAWLASYPACGAWGYSKQEALEALKEMTEVFLEVMADSNELVNADSVGYEDTPSQTILARAGYVDADSARSESISIPVPA